MCVCVAAREKLGKGKIIITRSRVSMDPGRPRVVYGKYWEHGGETRITETHHPHTRYRMVYSHGAARCTRALQAYERIHLPRASGFVGNHR